MIQKSHQSCNFTFSTWQEPILTFSEAIKCEMEHFICCDQSSTKKVTGDKFRQLMTILFSTIALTITTFALSKNHPNQRYFNVGPNLTKIVTGINFRTTNYFNQSINEIINWLLWEELLKLETMMDQKIGSRELLQKAPVVITKYGDF